MKPLAIFDRELHSKTQNRKHYLLYLNRIKLNENTVDLPLKLKFNNDKRNHYYFIEENLVSVINVLDYNSTHL